MKKHSLTIAFIFACCMLTLKGSEIKTPHHGTKTFCGKIGETRTDTFKTDITVSFEAFSPITQHRKNHWAIIRKL